MFYPLPIMGMTDFHYYILVFVLVVIIAFFNVIIFRQNSQIRQLTELVSQCSPLLVICPKQLFFGGKVRD